MSLQENSWEERLVVVLIIATIIPGVIDTIDYVVDPHSTEDDNLIWIYAFPIVIAILFWPLGLGIIAAIIVAHLRKNKYIMYVLWVIYLIILYCGLPFTMTGARWL